MTKNYRVSFTYDAKGLRTSKTVNGKTTIYVWDGDQLVMELTESGEVQKRYIRGNDLVYADKGTDTEKQYYVTDMHGNVAQLTDENGTVIKTYEYDSFGNEEKPDSKDDNPFRYCGEYYDKETEEIYLRARYYQPDKGRFLTRDTYTGEENEPLSLHLYTYCGNDGVNSVDPSGHKTIVGEKAMAGAAVWFDKYNKKGGQLINKKKGKILDNQMKKLRICTDGKVTRMMRINKYYGDKNHGKKNTTACFGKYVSADEIPYIVVPPSKSAYKYSVGVIINTSDKSFLYCVVAEVGSESKGMGEVSIYAAWKMQKMAIPKNNSKVNKAYNIGNRDQKATKKWRIILFEKSAPQPQESRSKYGWKYNKKAEEFREQIKKEGKSCYWSNGKCLN